MKRIGTLTALLLTATGAFAQVNDYRDIKAPALRTFSMPQPKRIALPNGMVIFLQEDHELPLVTGTATIRGGARNVPAEKTGLTSIYTQAWRTGGTATRSGDELDEFLDARAARVETNGDSDSTTVMMDALKNDFDAVFPIWLDVLRNPAFRQEKIDLAKTQANTGISRRNDEPGGILSREAQKLGYGPNSPYARQAEYATIASITRDDLVDFHRRTVHPNNIILAFIGDFDSAKLERRLRDTFASWPRGPQVEKPAFTATPAAPGLYFVRKEDVTQANIAMVHAGIERNHPDYYALQVMNEILSGGFSGRLMQALRSQRGLTYGVGGSVGANWDYPGLFRAQMATKSETAIESVEALRGELTKMTSSPVTADELSLAKESLLNAFVFTMDTRAKALNQQVLLEFYGFPSNYFTQYPAMIGKVTAADVERVAKTHVHPDRLAILVVGNDKSFERPLTSLGKVTPIDITIPEPSAAPSSGATPSRPAAPAASNAEGMALVNKVVAFIGGANVIDTVRTLRRDASMTMHTPQGAMEAQVRGDIRYSDGAQRAVMQLPMGEMTRVVGPNAAFMITPMGTQDLPASQRESSIAEFRGDMINILRNRANPKYTFAVTGTESIGGTNAQVLEINADGTPIRWYVEPSGRVLRTVTRVSQPVPGEQITDLADWKSFGGLNIATTAVVTRNGEKTAEVKLNTAELNVELADQVFVKP